MDRNCVFNLTEHHFSFITSFQTCHAESDVTFYEPLGMSPEEFASREEWGSSNWEKSQKKVSVLVKCYNLRTNLSTILFWQFLVQFC